MNRRTATALGIAERRLGVGDQPNRPREGPGAADGGGQSGHGLDLERDRQARRGVEPGSADAPESREGFLLNHVISEFRKEADGAVQSNSDPITGQAAWYDLRVRVEKAEAGATEPHYSTLAAVHPD